MTILGIDPGVASVGFGIIEEKNNKLIPCRFGEITTPAGMKLSQRLMQIKRDVEELIKIFKPDAMAVEELFFAKNKKTAMIVAQARAAIILAGAEQNIDMCEYTPLQIKNAVTGYGRAGKAQVMEMVRRLLNMEQIPKPDHAADALAVAICHIRTAGSLLTAETENKGVKICSTI